MICLVKPAGTRWGGSRFIFIKDVLGSWAKHLARCFATSACCLVQSGQCTVSHCFFIQWKWHWWKHWDQTMLWKTLKPPLSFFRFLFFSLSPFNVSLGHLNPGLSVSGDTSAVSLSDQLSSINRIDCSSSLFARSLVVLLSHCVPRLPAVFFCLLPVWSGVQPCDLFLVNCLEETLPRSGGLRLCERQRELQLCEAEIMMHLHELYIDKLSNS